MQERQRPPLYVQFLIRQRLAFMTEGHEPPEPRSWALTALDIHRLPEDPHRIAGRIEDEKEKGRQQGFAEGLKAAREESVRSLSAAKDDSTWFVVGR